MNKNTLVIIGVCVILLLVGGGVSWYTYNKNRQTVMTDTESRFDARESSAVPSPEEILKPTVGLVLSSSDTTLRVGQKGAVTVSVGSMDTPIKAATIAIVFNPAVVKAESVEAGNYWTQSNVLEQSIDNEKGIVKISLGQGFDAQPSGNALLATMTFSGVSPGVSTLTNGEETMLVRTSMEGNLIVTTTPITITVQ